MGRSASIGLLFCALGMGFGAPESLAPLRQEELGDGVDELRRAISDIAFSLSRIEREGINSEDIFFEGQRRRLRGLLALARCVEFANDGMRASRDKAVLSACLSSLRSELSQAAHEVRSIQSANEHGHKLTRTGAFRPLDKTRPQQSVGVGESIAP